MENGWIILYKREVTIKQRWLLYPVLFAIYPVLALFSNNLGQFEPGLIYRPLLWMIVLVLILLLVTRIIAKSWQKAGLLSTLYIVLFFSYGHIYNLFEGLEFGGLLIGRHRYLVIVWLFFFLGGSWWTLKKLRSPEGYTVALNIVAIVALIYPSFVITNYYLSRRSIPSATQKGELKSTSVTR